jgi:hypothetical protein
LEHLCWENVDSPINIGNGRKILLFDLVNLIKEKMNRSDLIVRTDESELHLVSDVSHLKRLGLENESIIENYISKMVQSYKAGV